MTNTLATMLAMRERAVAASKRVHPSRGATRFVTSGRGTLHARGCRAAGDNATARPELDREPWSKLVNMMAAACAPPLCKNCRPLAPETWKVRGWA